MEGSAHPTPRASGWQQSLQNAVRSTDELLRLLDLRPDQVPDRDPDPGFPLLVPREFIARMRPGDAEDPLLLQVLPTARERDQTPGFAIDPVGDMASGTARGVLHKYPARVLLIASGMCAVHCRYCFRRHFPYEDQPKSMEQWQPALESIAADASIEEVILSGGDPLSLGNGKLQQLVLAIDAIAHVRRLRIHTRFPVMIPDRVDSGLMEMVRQTRLKTLLVWHINHAQEIDQHVAGAARRLSEAGAMQLNQSVLLRRVNDTLDAMVALSKRLIDMGILPYYLHQLDRVQGAAHFESSIEQGETLVRAMRDRLPGYAVPRFVREISGEPSKTLIR